MVRDDGSLPARIRARVRELAHTTYFRLARANYDHEWVARRNRTPAGTFRCYDPLNRHGSDPMLEELAACCGPRDVVFDVGANVGVYALALAMDAPDRRVVAFEPSPRVVDRLRANVRVNGLERCIDVRACGLGDGGSGSGESDGGGQDDDRDPSRGNDRPFYVSTYPELSAFDPESASRWDATVAETVTVPCYRLDDLAPALPVPDVLKLDVEGGAPVVLRGARETLERHHPTLFVEIHEEGLSRDVPGEIRAVLADLDPSYDVLERDGFWRCEPA